MAIKSGSVNKKQHERRIKSRSIVKVRKKQSNDMADVMNLQSIIKKKTTMAIKMTDTKKMYISKFQEKKSVILGSDSAE